MKHILWIDDVRDPNSQKWKEYLAYVAEEFLDVPLNECVVNWVKNKNEFIQHLIVETWPDLICFDHDLGLGPTGYDCAKYLVDMCMETGNPLPEFTSQSSNPVGREDIICLLENYKKHAELRQDLIENLEDIHSLEELDKISTTHYKSEIELEKAFRKARARIAEEQRTTRRNEEQKFRSNLAAEICGLLDLNYGSCEMIVDRAWTDHHSYGNQEVINAAHSLASFIEQIIKNEYQQ